ncbi:MAG: hypothetical protein IPJ19_17355 [Planctomycetes bacterium]|nr:hypothetical protein [Planctomycetota bacterium]
MLLTTLALTVSIGLPYQDAKTAAPLDLLRAVPKDAWMFAQVHDFDALRGDLEKNAFWKLYQDPESTGLRDWAENLFKQGAENQVDPTAEEFMDFLGSVHGSMLVFVAPPASGSEPDFVLIVDPGGPRDAFEKHFDKFVESEMKKLISSTSTYDGVELHVCEEKPAEEKPGPAGSPPPAPKPVHHSVYFDSGSFAAMSASTDAGHALELAQATIDRLRGKEAAEGVAASARYLEAKASASARGRIEVFADFAQLVPVMLADRKAVSESEDKMLAALGLPDTRWAYLTADAGSGEQARIEFSLALAEKGLLHELVALLGKLPREAARAFPKESQGVTLYAIDVPGLWSWIWKLVEVTKPGGAQAARAQLQGAGQAMGGIDIEKDVIGQLSGEFGMNLIEVPADEWLAANPLGGGMDEEDEQDPDAAPKPAIQVPKGGSLGQAWWIGLRDSKAFGSTLESVLEATGIAAQFETEDFQGKTVWSLPMPTGGSLSYSFTNKGMVISTYPSALRSVLRMEGKEAPDSALERPSFKPVIAENPDAGVFSITNTGAMMKSMLSAFTMVNTQFAARGADNAFPELPPVEAIDRYFQGTATTTMRHKNGVLSMRFAIR